MSSPFVIVQKRIRPHGSFFVRIVLSLSLLFFPILVYGSDDPCEGTDSEPVKMASSLPRLPSADLAKVTFDLKEAESHFVISVRVAGRIVAERFVRKPNPIEAIVEIQPIKLGGYSGLYINYSSGATGGIACPHLLFPSPITNSFFAIESPGSKIEDIDADGETEIIALEWAKEADCGSARAFMPYWHRIYHVNPQTRTTYEVSKQFPKYYASLAQDYQGLLDELNKNPNSPAVCKQGMRNLIRRASELVISGSNANHSVAMDSGWYWPTGASMDHVDFCGYLGWLKFNSPSYPWHLAQDMCNGSKEGNPVYSIGDGEVILSRTDVGSYGPNYTKGGALIARYRSADGTSFTALYGHLTQPRGIGPVSAGEIIGYSNAWNPPHVHFAIHPGYSLEPNNPWRGYTDNRSETYGFTNPIPFLTAHPRTAPDTRVRIIYEYQNQSLLSTGNL
jgi:hypothetical protein